MEYELEEWLDETEVRLVTNLEQPLTVLGGGRWLDASAYVRSFTQNAEVIPEESDGPPVIDLRTGLVDID